MAMTMKTAVLWAVVPCRLVNSYQSTWCYIPEDSHPLVFVYVVLALMLKTMCCFYFGLVQIDIKCNKFSAVKPVVKVVLGFYMSAVTT
jgi:hypothetical protein